MLERGVSNLAVSLGVLSSSNSSKKLSGESLSFLIGLSSTSSTLPASYFQNQRDTSCDPCDPVCENTHNSVGRLLSDYLKHLCREMNPMQHQEVRKVIYEPLDQKANQIRVLIIQPGQLRDHLDCQLRVVSLAHEPTFEYETISYCWLEWNETYEEAEMMLDGQSFRAPHTSIAAVRRIRLVKERRTIWIDAICINQQDIAERNSQVALMGTIYRKASRNLVFLGDDEQSVAEETVKSLRTKVRDLNEAEKRLSTSERKVWATGTAPDSWFSNGLVTVGAMEELRHLYSLRWFTRLWVLQEVVLARSNICYWGSTSFPLSDVLRVSLMYQDVMSNSDRNIDLSMIQQATYRAIDDLRQAMRLSMPGRPRDGLAINWSMIYHLGSKRFTTDTRDQVYALVGLFQECHLEGAPLPSSIAPEYKKSVHEVFRDATKFGLEVESDYLLTWIAHENTTEFLIDDKPSWSLDWNRHRDAKLPLTRVGIRPGSASPWPLCVGKATDANVFRVKGFVLPPVEWTTDPLQWEKMEQLPWLRDFTTTLLSRLGAVLEAESIRCIENILVSVLLCGQYDHDRSGFNNMDQAVKAYKALMRYDQEILPTYGDDTPSGRIGIRIMDISDRRVLFTTSDRRVGSGPLLIQKGDLPFIMLNGRFMHILRPVDDHYLYVGPAYLHGLMDAEVFGLDLAPTWVTIR
ncbi:hypothetical protein AC579_4683 [Pseudocercospora musae]|uniref:Heterokaryon incompatibility domain-containing protein n=1 Tax=Pseudocercospora musae TaxID=113226 RepID=A0A139IBI9_9PEZI|nr:hypothetical protein AC579_4683 [Pseudocercospora musae]